MPDCGDNSCLYAPKKGGMRTNGGCRCDECPRCGVPIRPRSPRSHRVWCSTPGWVPEHHAAAPPVEWRVHPAAQLQHAKDEADDWKRAALDLAVALVAEHNDGAHIAASDLDLARALLRGDGPVPGRLR